MKLSPKAQQAMDKVVAQFQGGDIAPIVKMSLLHLPADAPARKWTYANRCLAYCQTLSVDLRGYRQWQAVGRQVRKGTHAAFILAPLTYREEDEDGKMQTRLRGFRAVAVHPYENTDGEEDGFSYEPRDPPPLMGVAERLGLGVAYAAFAGDAAGSINAEGKKVTFYSSEVSVWFHELGHAVHARLNGRLEPGQHEHQEAVAELASTVLMEMYGYGDYTGNCWEVIGCYAKDPLAAIMKAMADVEAIVGLILENGKERAI